MSGSGVVRGLHIGVDRYESSDIGNLASAVRDAQALHALFSDNTGGEHVLLADEQATAARLRHELIELQSTSTDDAFVVITFSGHGTRTHELATYDINLCDMAGTGMPLDEFTDLVSAIPARHLLVVLDCCFSGAAGAKVLQTPQPRGASLGLPKSTDAFLAKLDGAGRVILTAATADQEAWEDPTLGHGYLTWFLLQALLGKADDDGADTIDLYSLLKYVTRNVIANASGTYRVRQEPTLRGQFDGEVRWTLFTPGPAYTALFPSPASTPATRAIASLEPYGIPGAVLDRWAQQLDGLTNCSRTPSTTVACSTDTTCW